MITTEKPGTPEELVHHGIKGMHWGIRKEEDSSSGRKAPKQISTKKEARAQRHEDNGKKLQMEIDRIKANPSKVSFIQRHRDRRVKDLEQARDTENKAAQDIRSGHMTDFQKKALIGAGVVAAVLITYGAYKLTDSGQLRQALTKNIPLKKDASLARKMSKDEIMNDVVKQVNPDYGGFGTKLNCRRCTFAYEMRRRGFDVRSTHSLGGTGQTPTALINAIEPGSKLPTGRARLLAEAFREQLHPEKGGPVTEIAKNAPLGRKTIGKGILSVLDPHEKSGWIFEQLAKNPEGARGELGLTWEMGGSHSMAWEIIHGVPHVFDAQSGHAYNQHQFAEVAEGISKAGMTRLDNIPLNNDFLRRWIQNA